LPHTSTNPTPTLESKQEDKLDLAKSLEELAAKKGVKFILPTDVVVADKFAPDANSKVRPPCQAGVPPCGSQSTLYVSQSTQASHPSIH
jgi:3-phosphoglycerate kinase